jgi:hypothetical protein
MNWKNTNLWIMIFILISSFLMVVAYPLSSTAVIKGSNYTITDSFSTGTFLLSKKGVYEQDKYYFGEHYQENLTNIMHPTLVLPDGETLPDGKPVTSENNKRIVYRPQPYKITLDDQEYHYYRVDNQIQFVHPKYDPWFLINEPANPVWRNNPFSKAWQGLTGTISKDINCPSSQDCSKYFSTYSTRFYPSSKTSDGDFTYEVRLNMTTSGDKNFGLISKLTIPPDFEMCNGQKCYGNQRSVENAKIKVDENTEIKLRTENGNIQTKKLKDLELSEYELNRVLYLPDYLPSYKFDKREVDLDSSQPIYFRSKKGGVRIEFKSEKPMKRVYLEQDNYNLSFESADCNSSDCSNKINVKVTD